MCIRDSFCITVDFETLGENDASLKDTVTIRHRDSMEQERVAIKDQMCIRDRLGPLRKFFRELPGNAGLEGAYLGIIGEAHFFQQAGNGIEVLPDDDVYKRQALYPVRLSWETCCLFSFWSTPYLGVRTKAD